MKRIFYQLEEDIYFDWDGFMELVEKSGFNVRDLEGSPLIREGKTYSNTFNHPPTPKYFRVWLRRMFADKADEPDEAPKRKFWSEDGSLISDRDHVRKDVGLHLVHVN